MNQTSPSRSGIVAAAIIVALTVAACDKGVSKADSEAADSRIAPVAGFELKTAAAGGGAKDPQSVYTAVCAACHGTGVAGAPKKGDKAAWAPRLAQGLDALVKSAIAGKGAMPPKGGTSNLSDAEFKAVVEFISK
jgi:cytochrome c5